MLRFKMVFIILSLLTGCTGNKTFFSKESDVLTKSPCTKSCPKPFYVDGRWI